MNEEETTYRQAVAPGHWVKLLLNRGWVLQETGMTQYVEISGAVLKFSSAMTWSPTSPFDGGWD